MPSLSAVTPASRNTSVNRLFDELATTVLVQHDLSVQFRAAAESGDPAMRCETRAKIHGSGWELGHGLPRCARNDDFPSSLRGA